MNSDFNLFCLFYWMILQVLVITPVARTDRLFFACFSFENALWHGDYKQHSDANHYLKKVTEAGEKIHGARRLACVASDTGSTETAETAEIKV